MRAPFRFLLVVLGGWSAARALWLIDPAGEVRLVAGERSMRPLQRGNSLPNGALAFTTISRTPPGESPWHSVPIVARSGTAKALLPPPAAIAAPSVAGLSPKPSTPNHAIPPTGTGSSRWSGSAALFVRGGAGLLSPLPAGGQLGGSQAYARLAWRINPGEKALPLSATTRLYVPIGLVEATELAPGIEIGLSQKPALRLTLERRIALGSQGRDAWAVMLSGGGQWVGLPHDLEIDAYGQAGIVGAKRHDGFVDGLVRVGKGWDIGRGMSVIAGAGLWGAKQPDVERLDLGPRVALHLPVKRTNLSLALEGRVRIAGDARPGSSLALTLASDF